MKNQMMRVVSTTIFSKFFKATAIVMLISGTSYLNAQVIATASTISTPVENSNAVIKHLETVNDMLVFEVRLNNVSGERFNVVIKDNDGSVLYHEGYNDKYFSKKFKLPKGDNEKLTFIIRKASGNISQTFEINSNVRYVEEVIVKKIA